MDLQTPLGDNFTFWTPPSGHTVTTGAESVAVSLPQLPLPILRSDLGDEPPTDQAIGSGLYDYLRQFPDCPLATDYAGLLRDIWPHYLADLAAMIVMLDHKEVDAPYIRRKIAGLQILLLLTPGNVGLLQQLGIACYELAQNFVELYDCRSHLARALNYFGKADKAGPNDPATLNYMARIDYLIGDYPSAINRLQALSLLLDDAATRSGIAARIEQLRQAGEPERPLLLDLEAIGEAMRLLADGEPLEACRILERLDEEQVIANEFPSPEFYTLLAISRERCGDATGAQAAFAKALEIDPAHPDALSGLDRLTQGGVTCQTV